MRIKQKQAQLTPDQNSTNTIRNPNDGRKFAIWLARQIELAQNSRNFSRLCRWGSIQLPCICQSSSSNSIFLCKIPAEIQVIFCIAINVFHKQNEIWEAAPPVTHNRLKRVVPWSMCTLEGGKISPTKWLVWTDSPFYFVVLFSLNGSRVPWKIHVFSGTENFPVEKKSNKFCGISCVFWKECFRFLEIFWLGTDVFSVS